MAAIASPTLCISPNSLSVLPALSSRASPLRSGTARLALSCVQRRSRAKAGPRFVASSETESSSTIEIAAAVSGLVGAPVVAWSLYTLQTTGCGLPPGPGGSVGALEGVSFLAVFGIVGWSAYTKVKTGSGLPNGPYGLLGAAEGLAYLIVLASLVVGGFQVVENGGLPGPLPDDKCFG